MRLPLPRPRRLAAVVAGTGALIGSLLLAPVPAAGESAAASGTVTDLGPAIRTVNVRQAEFGELTDGTPVAYAISNGTPATFTVVNAATGERLFAQELPGYSFGSWIEVAPDGDVYFSARSPQPAAVMRLDPSSMAIDTVVPSVPGEAAFYAGSFDAAGTLFFGTYPHAKLVSYDPDAEAVRDYGSLTTDAAYVFSVGIVNGEVWAGTGPVPHLYRVDPASGDMTEMSVPDPIMANTDWFIGIEQREDLVFVRLSPRGTYDMAVYDLSTGSWRDEIIENTFGAEPTALARGGRFYMTAGGSLLGYHVPGRRQFSTGFEETPLPAALAESVGTYGMAVMNLRGRSFPGESVVGLTTDGDLWHFNLATRRTAVVPADILGSPIGAHSMGVAPDGSVYIGAYLSSGVMSRIDPATDAVENLRGPKQSDHIISHGEKIVISSYPGAVVHTGDPAGDWKWGTNPSELFQIGRGEPHFQDRIFAMASVGEKLAVGTVPDYGQLGGSVTIADPVTGDFEVHRNVVPDQSVVSMAARDGLVYGGTSIHGALSTEPSQTEAELFVWDVAAEQKVWSGVVVPGAEIIHEVAFGPDGMLWGMADEGTLFAFDPATRTVVRSIDTGLSGANVWGRRSGLNYRPADGRFYGHAAGRLFRFDPGALAFEVLVDGGVNESVVDGAGRIYFADATNVYRYEPTE